MTTNETKIKTIQFKRGTKASLEAKLTQEVLGVPLAGEPIFETDMGQLKIGDGIRPYKDLPYITGSQADIPDFVIQDPLSNQILLYDATLHSWVNKDLADKESIIYLAERGLTIKGYDEAKQGYMLVKDETEGLTWVKPLNDTQLQQAIVTAEAAAGNAGNYATQAGNSAVAAATSEGNATRINQQTMNWVNSKFWWGTLEEYNALTHIDPGTFYFIKAE